MKQASSNILQFPSRIELLWKQHDTLLREKMRIYALQERLAAGVGAVADTGFDRAEADADAAFNALEDIRDKILQGRTTSVEDLAIKSRVLALRDFGNGYCAEDVLRFCADVETFAKP